MFAQIKIINQFQSGLMTVSSLNQTTFVLQGEYGIAQQNGIIKTSIPKTCRIITAYDERSRTAFLAHMDDYTSAPSTIKKIITLFDGKRPVIKLLGGGATQTSRTNFKEISSILSFLDISFEIVPLKGYLKRPQIELDVENGTLAYFEEENLDQNLETLQRSEYAEFNDSLDREYSEMEGKDLPYFAVKEAKRSGVIMGLRSEITYERAPLWNTKKVLLQLLQKGLSKEYFSEEMRVACQEGDANHLLPLAVTDSQYLPLLDFLLTFQTQLGINRETINTSLTLAIRKQNEQAIERLRKPAKTDQEIAMDQLEELITRDLRMPRPLLAAFVDSDWSQLLRKASEQTSYDPVLKFLCRYHTLFPIDFTLKELPQVAVKCEIFKLGDEASTLLTSLKAKNYALLFRQAAQKPGYLSVLQSLARNAIMLNFDIRAKGTTSGSALDIAIRTNNTAAIAFLSELWKSEPYFEEQVFVAQLNKLPIFGDSNFNEITERVYKAIGQNIFKKTGQEGLQRIFSHINAIDPARGSTINSSWSGVGNDSWVWS